MNDELDKLRPEVREAIDGAVSFVLPSGATGTESDGRSWLQMADLPGVHITSAEWATVRAELLRLAQENEEWHAKCGDSLGQQMRERLRAEKAEAELAALKAKIAESPRVDVTLGCAIDGEIPPDLALCKVVLVKMEE